jgi:hypothetical protein
MATEIPPLRNPAPDCDLYLDFLVVLKTRLEHIADLLALLVEAEEGGHST